MATDDWLAKRAPAVAIAESPENKPLSEVPDSAQEQVVAVKVDANQMVEESQPE